MTLNYILQWCTRNNCKPSMFGRGALGDPSLIRDMKNGRTLRQKAVDRVKVFMDTHEK